MAKTLISNISGSHLILPLPYRGILKAGASVCVDAPVETVIANLGGARLVEGIFQFTEVPGANATDYHDDGAATLAPMVAAATVYGAAPAAVGFTSSAGSAASASRSDHTHALPSGVANGFLKLNAAGTAWESVAYGASTAPVGVAAAGTANTPSHSDHVHAHGNQAAGASMHAGASPSVAGFLSAADKTKLDALTAPTVTRMFQSNTPAARSNTSVHASFAGDDAGASFPGPFTNPAIPRNASATFAGAWDGGDITLHGTDQFDAVISEVILANPGNTVDGVKIFKTYTAAEKGAVGLSSDGCSLGTGNKLGLSLALANTDGLLFTDDVAEAVAVDAIHHAFTPATAPNGAHTYKLLVSI